MTMKVNNCTSAPKSVFLVLVLCHIYVHIIDMVELKKEKGNIFVKSMDSHSHSKLNCTVYCKF